MSEFDPKGALDAFLDRFRDPLLGPFFWIFVFWNWNAVYLLIVLHSEEGLRKAIYWSTSSTLNDDYPWFGTAYAFGGPVVLVGIYWLYLLYARHYFVKLRTRSNESSRSSEEQIIKAGQTMVPALKLEFLTKEAEAFSQACSIIMDLKTAALPPILQKSPRYFVLESGLALSGFVRFVSNKQVQPADRTAAGQLAYVVDHLGNGKYLAATMGAVEQEITTEPCITAEGRRCEPTDPRVAIGWLKMTEGGWVLVGPGIFETYRGTAAIPGGNNMEWQKQVHIKGYVA